MNVQPPYWVQRARINDIGPEDQVMVSPGHWVRWGSLSPEVQGELVEGRTYRKIRRNLAPQVRTLHHNSHARKVAHRSYLAAWWHAARLNRERGQRGAWKVYPCRWGGDWRDGPTASRHWHVGRVGPRTRYAKEAQGHGK